MRGERAVSGLIITSLAVLLLVKLDAYLSEAFALAFISVGFTAFLLLEFSLASFVYEPVEDRNHLEKVSLIIPARNEGKVIYETVGAAARSNYPAELLEIIVVNDGSTDGTKEELVRGERDFRIKAIHLEKNVGKRHAIAAGLRSSRGRIIATMDSDTFLDPNAVYNAVQYFSDPRVGAVCGHGRVHNRDKNVLTKMQDAWYDGMFTVFKGAESVFGMVTCCSGLFSLYRRKSIINMIESWAGERFLGFRVKAGDDRALTNLVLRPRIVYGADADDRLLTTEVAKRGERVVYARNAVAYTIVPSTLGKFLKQQVRWKRGWFRGNLVAFGFMWRKNPLGSFLYYLHTILAYLTPLVVARMLVIPVLEGRWMDMLIYVLGLAYIGFLYALHFAMRDPKGTWGYRILFQVTYNLFISPFLSLAAWLTVTRESWMTRS